MKYINAADVLPQKLLSELLKYVDGELLYVPTSGEKKKWGTHSGSRQYYNERNRVIIKLYQSGKSYEDLQKNIACLTILLEKLLRVRACFKLYVNDLLD